MHHAELDLTEVAEAVKAYDAQNDMIDSHRQEWTEKQYDASIRKLGSLGLSVKEAFYQATKDRNSRESAMLVEPGNSTGIGGWSWLRGLLRKDNLYYGVK